MRCPSPCEAILAGVVLFIASAASLAQTEKAAATGENQAAEEPTALALTTTGTRHSERSAASALSWLARQQQPDGSWDFQSHHDPDRPGSPEPAQWQSRTGATGLALLPFLAAGQTHKTRGPYQKTIAAGLQFLLHQADEHARQAKSGLAAADVWGEGGDLAWHAIAADTLCEAYGMSGDRELGKHAQLAVNFIAARQDRKSGSWAARRCGPATPTS